VIVTIVGLLGVVMITCLIGVAVIPTRDRRALLSLPLAEGAGERRMSRSRRA
jgi:hypothetical protein